MYYYFGFQLMTCGHMQYNQHKIQCKIVRKKIIFFLKKGVVL